MDGAKEKRSEDECALPEQIRVRNGYYGYKSTVYSGSELISKYSQYLYLKYIFFRCLLENLRISPVLIIYLRLSHPPETGSWYKADLGMNLDIRLVWLACPLTRSDRRHEILTPRCWVGQVKGRCYSPGLKVTHCSCGWCEVQQGCVLGPITSLHCTISS